MLVPHIKKKVDELWNRFWAAGLTNPLVAVEQITYLLFLQRLEVIDRKRTDRGHPSIYAGHEECKWSYIRQEKTNPEHLINVVFPWLREIDRHFTPDAADGTELASLDKRMEDAYFQLDPKKGQVLSDAIDTIDQLFARAGEGSAAQDIMGDTFEYLLSEVATAGKNGQFRTPRHIIRFMVDLLDPEPGSRIVDPAAGTGGFLFSAQQYLLRKYTPEANLRLEWDGTPHRLDGSKATAAQYAAIHEGANFIGLDNDRTMARIGWMNLVLHDLANPHLLQGDSLSKREGKDQRQRQLLEPEQYDFVLANPPFTGTVDSADLEPDALLFPRVGGRGRKKNDAITNKSELLFLWLMLDLLRVGGRCAVIVPEGVLFGNTDAHKQLRRELLTEHCVEAVISLPGGVFQPYTGVKTSILVFRKETRRDAKQTFNAAKEPATRQVWFYEVEQDGLSLDAKRNPRPGQRNDLWDALEKFRLWRAQGPVGAREHAKTLLQPSFHPERWRQASLRDSSDQLTPAGEAFAGQPDTGMWDGQVWAIHELFEELPADPKRAEAEQLDEAGAALTDMILDYFSAPTEAIRTRRRAAQESGKPMTDEAASDAWQKAIAAPRQDFNRNVRELQRRFFEQDDGQALPLWKALVKDRLETALSSLQERLTRPPDDSLPPRTPPKDLGEELKAVAREIAKLDGFDVTLRSLAVDQVSDLGTVKHWVVPVRTWAQNDDWRSEDGAVSGSHDPSGQVRGAYVQARLGDGLYDDKGDLKDDLLDPDCIEAREWNLSAGQYKPFDFSQLKSDKSVADLIDELMETEQCIIRRLDRLVRMVEGGK